MKTRFLIAGLLGAGPLALSGQAQINQHQLVDALFNLHEQVDVLQEQVADLQERLELVEGNDALLLDSFVGVDLSDQQGVPGPHVIFSGANVHVRSGSGSTDDMPWAGAPMTGLGNLIVGYDELPDGALDDGARAGSHNLVVGRGHVFSSWGGLVAGEDNAVTGACSVVSGGMGNVASGLGSSVSGGQDNAAAGGCASISGGRENLAEGLNTSVTGGDGNVASGLGAAISGGQSNTASGSCASVTGGSGNVSGGVNATICGGWLNTAGGDRSVVGGGASRSTDGPDDWAAGSLLEDS